MFKKIVVPVDGSESAWRALEQAAALACKFEGELLVMTVIQPYNNAALLAIPLDHNIISQSNADLEEVLWLYGAACCPDLWQHPRAVRFSLRPLIGGGVVPRGTVSAAVIEEYDNACLRWQIRKNW